MVLGAAQYNGGPSQIYEARLAHAVDLFEAGVAPILVVTGGKAEGDRTTEADAGRSYALDRGVPESAILAEDQGRTTLESLEGVAALFRANDLVSAVFVSDRTHMLRVLRIATDVGIEAWGSPTTTSPIDTNPLWQGEATIHELGALGVYFFGDVTKALGDSGIVPVALAASAPAMAAILLVVHRGRQAQCYH